MKSSLPIDRILVSLDALVDTRAGVILQKYPHLYDKLVTPAYYGREIDEFKCIDTEEYKALYRDRDVDTLKHTMMTNIHLLLASFIKSCSEEIVNGGPQTRIIFSLNIYPYDLDEVEKEELIFALESILGDAAEFQIESLPLERLTPEHCKENYAVMVLYDFADWMTIHSEAFKETRMPSMVVYAPRIYGKKPDAAAFKEFAKADLDPFDAAVFAASPAFTLRFLSIDTYCLRNADYDIRRSEMEMLRAAAAENDQQK